MTNNQDPIDPDRYYTPEEAATILHVHVATIYRWVKQGVLPDRKIQRSRRLLGADVLDALANEPEGE